MHVVYVCCVCVEGVRCVVHVCWGYSGYAVYIVCYALLAPLPLCTRCREQEMEHLETWPPALGTRKGKDLVWSPCPLREALGGLTLCFVFCLGHRLMKERLTFTIFKQAHCVRHCWLFWLL